MPRRRSVLLHGLAGLLAGAPLELAPAPARAEAGPPPPPSLTLPAPPPLPPPPAAVPALPVAYVERPRYGLLYAGIALFGASYVPSAAAGLGGREPSLALPVIGPLIAIARLGGDHCDRDRTAFCGVDRATHGSGAVWGLLVLDAAVQATGAALALAGALSRHRVPVEEAVAVAPWATPAGGGLAVAGRF